MQARGLPFFTVYPGCKMVPSRGLVAAALVLTLALSGCLGVLDGGQEVTIDPEEYEGEQLQEGALTAMSEVETYSFTVDSEVRTVEELPGDNRSEVTVATGARGTADESRDVARYEFETHISGDMSIPGLEGEALHVGDRAYLGQSGEWTDRSSGVEWSPAGQEVALLEGADASVEGAALVDGREAVVLSVEPANDAAVAGYGLHGNVTPDLRPDDPAVSSANVTMYVSPEAPHHVYRTELEATGQGDVRSFDSSITITYDEFDEDHAVEIPAAVEE